MEKRSSAPRNADLAAPLNAWWLLLARVDRARRRCGRGLAALGLGPLQSPSRVVLAEAPVTVKAYAAPEAAGPVVLLVPAPIKRAYIWDLAPWASVVQQCLRAGLRPYLVQWERPGSREQSLGLADYADRLLLRCLAAVAADSGQRQVLVAGHSLGGTLAAIFAALHPARVRGLVLLGAPLHFGPDAGPFGLLTSLAPRASVPADLPEGVPGSFLDLVSAVTAPVTFVWAQWLDWPSSLGNPRALATRLRLERWLLDELPLPRRLFTDVVEWLYREDRFQRGTLRLGGREVGPRSLAVPTLSVVYARCAVAPPQSVLPFHRALGDVENRLLWYPGDVGVAIQHLGMLVGERAHRHLWPEILRWLRRHG